MPLEDLCNCKILILGESQVGKSSILGTFTERRFIENIQPTLGIDYKIMPMQVSGSTVKLQIWDTAGQERFRSITNSFFKNCQAVLLVFDLSDRDSFHKVKAWLNDIEEKASNDVVVTLLGNKCDLKDDYGVEIVSQEEIDVFTKAHNIKYFSTSAKLNYNIYEAFHYTAKEVKDKNSILSLGAEPAQKLEVVKSKKTKCCT